MATPFRATNGITNVPSSNFMGQALSLDPTLTHTYFNDFDVYAAGDWTVTETQAAATEALTDADDNAERTGHKIRVTMKDSSFGCEGRTGVFTYDHQRGIINTHEEIFLLGANRGIIDRPTNSQYAFGDKKWNGKPAMLEALRTNPDLAKEVLMAVRAADMEHRLDHLDAAKGLGVEADDT
mgnify:CR=1 FL=1